MSLVSLLDGHLAFGMMPLLDGAAFTLQPGEKVGLIGRNGTGKSSLLGVIAGAVPLDAGVLKRKDGLRTAWVEQEPVLPEAATLHESLVARAPEAQHKRLEPFLHRFELDGARGSPGTFSGGQRKRAALALAFALEPDILLLDEPTNHLDMDGIEQLEQSIARSGAAALIITHDRRFLDAVTTRILELDRGTLRSYPGNFSNYERVKGAQLEAEQLANRRFEKFWAQEEVWIRKGIEARRTRNEGRVRRLEGLREARASRRERLGDVRLAIDAGDRSGKLVAELTDVDKRFGDEIIVAGLSMRIMRGDRIGFIGRNGSGKTTLLRLILGELAPDSGTVRLGTQLQPAYFDQLRVKLDPDSTVAEAISPGSEWIEVGGARKHVTAYLADFLFSARRARSPIGLLSGGERNRLLLARLFAQPANLLVLDEPTNDLDMESLELLESTLQGYSGTLLLVSHDREFLDNVVTQTVVAEGAGRWREHVGGYSDWLRQRSLQPATRRRAVDAPAATRERARLSFMEQRELAALPGEIGLLEQERDALAASIAAPHYHRARQQTQRSDQTRITELEALLAQKLARWETLETRAG